IFMPLKHELQLLEIGVVEEFDTALSERLTELPRAEVEAEVIRSIQDYPALDHLVHLVVEQAFADGCNIEEVAARGTGASHAILVLTTIADTQELPSI